MRNNVVVRIFNFYVKGFRQMTLGKILWTIILIKLFIMFFVLKLFFFPNLLSKKGDNEDKQEYVAGELIRRGIND